MLGDFNKKNLNNLNLTINKKIILNNKKVNKVCLKWLRCSKFSVKFLPAKNETVFLGNSKISEFKYADYFWMSSFNSRVESNSNQFLFNKSPKYLFFYKNIRNLGYYDCFFKNYFINQVNFRMSSYGSVIESSIKKKLFKKDYDNFKELLWIKGTGIPVNFRCLKRKYLKSKLILYPIQNKKLPFKYSKIVEKNKLKVQFSEFKNIKNNNKKLKIDSSSLRFWNYFNKNSESIYLRNLGGLGFPITDLIKRNQQIKYFPVKITPYRQYNLTNQFIRHPSTTFLQLKRYITSTISFQEFNCLSFKDSKKTSYSLFYGVIWRYFKMKMEGFFYKKLGIRMHIWFLNIWDLFINGINSQWHWFRYENSTVRFLMKKGKQFLIEDKESAKFYVRTMALTITMVGGAKLFMDNVSSMLANYRNNWAFILSVTRSLRYCINFFWFRFFINYKVTLQGKIGGFLRAAKKIFKKGTITIEDRSSAITYYRGYPVTRFGVYNLSFWLQYRIPTLIGKFEDLEYIDTMKVLLGTYSVPWLAQRLAGIVSAILQDRVYKINIKVAQYDRRIRTRQKLFLDLFHKNRPLIDEKNYFNESLIINNIRKKKIKNLIKANKNTKVSKWFDAFFSGKTKKLPNQLKNETEFKYSFNPVKYIWKINELKKETAKSKINYFSKINLKSKFNFNYKKNSFIFNNKYVSFSKNKKKQKIYFKKIINWKSNFKKKLKIDYNLNLKNQLRNRKTHMYCYNFSGGFF